MFLLVANDTVFILSLICLGEYFISLHYHLPIYKTLANLALVFKDIVQSAVFADLFITFASEFDYIFRVN